MAGICTYIATWKEVAEIFEASITSLAIIFGGGWAYLRFVRNRLRYPKAEVSHEIFFRELSAEKSLIHVAMTVVNRGDVLLPIRHVWTKLYKISPVSGCIATTLEENRDPVPGGEAEVSWPELCCREVRYEKGQAEIEPGEMEKFHFDFIFDSNIRTVEIYSYFENSRKKKRGPMGWALTSIFDIQDHRGGVNDH